MSIPPTSSDRLVDDVEVAQAEEVHLQEPERLDVLHGELGDDLLVGALLLERRYSVSGRSPMTTPAAWIESWRTSPSSGLARSTIWRTISSAS